MPGLIETLRGESDGTVPRLDRHLMRLSRSAAVLGISFQEREARDLLLRAAAKGGDEGRQRLRLHLSAQGALTIAVTPFRLQDETTVWRLAFSSQRLDPSDPLRRYKSDRREVYDLARAQYDPSDVDEVLLLNERGEIAEGTITNLFIDPGSEEGVLLTPPLRSGCLPGIEREVLMAEGLAREQRLMPQDLRIARAIFVGNSLRGLVRARLADDACPRMHPASVNVAITRISTQPCLGRSSDHRLRG